MAGDWLKVEKGTPDKPEIAGLCALLGIDADVAFAKCFRLWCWADSHTIDGNASRVTTAFLDSIVNLPGFSNALIEVGWLVARSGSLQFPNFDQHMGESAKKRALTAKRVAACKDKRTKSNAKGNAPSVSEALPREEKRREEARVSSETLADAGEPPEQTPKKTRKPNPLWDALVELFKLKPVTKNERTHLGRIVSDLKLKGATPQEIIERAERYKRHWPDIDITAEALLRHWDKFGPDGVPGNTAEAERSRLEREDSQRRINETKELQERMRNERNGSDDTPP